MKRLAKILLISEKFAKFAAILFTAWFLSRDKQKILSFKEGIAPLVLLAGMLLVNRLGTTLLLVGIGLYALTTLFSIVTLPVEINASRRALVWLNSHNITSPDTHRYAESALRAAAYTYIMAAVTSLATLIYYIMVYSNRR